MSDSPSKGRATLLSTAGPAAIAVIRVNGSGPVEPLCRLLGRRDLPRQEVFRAGLRDEKGELIDDILAVVSRRENPWSVELHLHGNPWLVQRTLEALTQAGYPGYAESVDQEVPFVDALERDALELLPQMLTGRGAAWLLGQPARVRAEMRRIRDLPRDEYRAACQQLLDAAVVSGWFSRSLRIAIVGPPNAGKSTLMNRLAGSSVSIVSAVAGTTRDWVEASTEWDGFPVTWVDTAGVRDTEDGLERQSIERAMHLLSDVDAVVFVVDSTRPDANEFVLQFAPRATRLPWVVAWNKSDQPSESALPRHRLGTDLKYVYAGAISAETGAGVSELVRQLLLALGRHERLLEQPAAFHDRIAQILQRTGEPSTAPTPLDAVETALLSLTHAARRPSPGEATAFRPRPDATRPI